MNEKTMNAINTVLYYVLAPILILEFLLSDLHIITFTSELFIASLVILAVFFVVTTAYKRNHPDYKFEVNVMYTRVLFVIVLLECFYTAGFFQW